MSVFKKQNLVAQYPAYNVFKRETSSSSSAVHLTYDEQLILKTDNPRTNHLHTFSICSVVGYALEYNNDPIAAYNRAVARNHPTHWISANASVLSADKREPVTMIEVEIGMLVIFEGILFTIQEAANRNLQLVKLAHIPE